MPLPRRDYFYFQEVVEKLEITEFDLQYYMSHGYLSGCVFVSSEFVSRNERMKKFETVPELFSGYLYLHQYSCRELFDCGTIYQKEFYLDFPDYKLLVPDDKPGLVVRRTSLMICRWDLEYFIDSHELNGEEEKPSNMPGRPSAMFEVLEEYERRLKSNEAYKNKSREALALRDWARLNIKDKPVPGVNTIRGWLSEPKDKPANAA